MATNWTVENKKALEETVYISCNTAHTTTGKTSAELMFGRLTKKYNKISSLQEN